MRLKLISCQVLCREVAAVARRSPQDVEIGFLPMGLHEMPCAAMRDRIQEAVNAAAAASPPFDAVLLGYGFCNHGIVGLSSGNVSLVIPRAHDCLTLLLGGLDRHEAVFGAVPGTYFRSTGWLEHRNQPPEITAQSIPRRLGMAGTRQQWAERHGAEAADYLHEVLGNPVRHYERLAFIRTGLEPGDRHEAAARAEADRLQLRFETVPGDVSMLTRLLNGDWNDEFLVVPPHHTVEATYDRHLVTAIPSPSP